MNQRKNGLNFFVATLTLFAIIILVSCTGEQREIPDTPFTKELGARNHRISKERAIAMLRAYDVNADSLRNGGFRGDTLVLPILPKRSLLPRQNHTVAHHNPFLCQLKIASGNCGMYM